MVLQVQHKYCIYPLQAGNLFSSKLHFRSVFLKYTLVYSTVKTLNVIEGLGQDYYLLDYGSETVRLSRDSTCCKEGHWFGWQTSLSPQVRTELGKNNL